MSAKLYKTVEKSTSSSYIHHSLCLWRGRKHGKDNGCGKWDDNVLGCDSVQTREEVPTFRQMKTLKVQNKIENLPSISFQEESRH
jgi:hypothetical protein